METHFRAVIINTIINDNYQNNKSTRVARGRQRSLMTRHPYKERVTASKRLIPGRKFFPTEIKISSEKGPFHNFILFSVTVSELQRPITHIS